MINPVMMIDNMWFVAALWIGLAFAASLISIKLGITVALIEILMGIILGNFFAIHETAQWIDFLASMGSLTLTFLAGSEIDPESFKKNLKPSLAMGLMSFAIPFAGVSVFASHILGWGTPQALIAGLALSTTSVAIVYSVVIEKGLSNTSFGKLMLTACFITDIGTVLALGFIFTGFSVFTIIFIAVLILMIFLAPVLIKRVIASFKTEKVSEPEIKLIFLILFVLAGLATTAKSEAILPSFIMGFVVAGIFVKDKTLINRIRTISFAFFTPFFFIKAGLNISLNFIAISLGIIVVLLILKVVFKAVAVWPVARAIKLGARTTTYTALIMSTGLTFGSIAALFGFNNGIIDQSQYTILITVVILSGIIPTIIAQKFFEPSQQPVDDEKTL